VISGFFRAALEPLAGRPAILAEMIWGVLAGMLLFLVFRRFANIAAVRTWKRKRSAYVLSLYLFGDDPALSLGSLGQIAKANAALLLYALPPLLIAAPFVAAIAVNLNEFFTPTPLAHGGAAVLTVQLSSLPVSFQAPQPCEVSLEAPAWLHVDLPPVHIPAASEISWRIRATSPSRGFVEIACNGERVTKEIDARASPRYFAKLRARDLASSLLHPGESRLPSGPIESIALSESLSEPWALWFACIASLTAWLLWGGQSWLQPPFRRLLRAMRELRTRRSL
jgi:hypothetical protein